jgi:hypothetical protein
VYAFAILLALAVVAVRLFLHYAPR